MDERPVPDFAARVREIIDRFRRARGIASPVVEIELRDKTRFRIESISPEPGDGFVTFAVLPEEDVPKEIIVPLREIMRIELFDRDEPEQGFGFGAR